LAPRFFWHPGLLVGFDSESQNKISQLKDWLWYITFPLLSYIVLIVAAILLQANPELVLYIISAVMVVLLFIGIHNA